MKSKHAAITLTVLALTIIQGQASRAGQWTWQELYKWDNYIDAADELKSELDKGKNTVVNNYYYADCLLRLHRDTEALQYYEKVYRMAPKSKFGEYSKRVLLRYRKLSEKNVTVGLSPARKAHEQGVKAPTDDKTAKSNDKKDDTQLSAVEKDRILSQLKGKLPRVPRAFTPSPSVAEIGGWSDSAQADYYSTAASRVGEAESRLQDAEELLKDATARIAGSGTSFRMYGESKEQTQARIDATKELIEKALQPFNDHVDKLTKQVNDERALLQLCVNARNRIYSTPYYGIPIYHY